MPRYEWRDGRRFVVHTLPEAKPPRNRSKRTHFHYADVDKSGNLEPMRRKRGKAKAALREGTKLPFVATISTPERSYRVEVVQPGLMKYLGPCE